MSRSRAALQVLVLAALLGGCAFRTSTLHVGYDDAKAARGPLSAVDSCRIRLEVTDRRLEPGDLIGYKRDNYPFPIVAPRPAREIVQDALAAELRKNNHVVVLDDADRFLRVSIREFWLDIQPGVLSRYLGTAAITMVVADGRTGRALLTREYQGNADDSGLISGEGNWEPVLNTALERMMRDVATDPRLVEALRTPSRLP